MSNLLESFKQSVANRNIDWIDGYDLDAFAGLSGSERQQALDIIASAIDSGDLRAVRAVRDVADNTLVNLLLEKLPAFDFSMRVEAAIVLKELGQGDGLDREILAVLATGEADDRRVAAHYLRLFPGDATVNALFRNLEIENDRPVRQSAIISLMLVLGVITHEFDLSRRDLFMRLTDGDQNTRTLALQELAALSGANHEAGSDSSSSSQCPGCNNALVPGARFCRYCGRKLEK